MALALLNLTLAACASLSETECRDGDWYRVGMGDGSGGAGERRLQRHIEACAAYGIEPDVEQYQAGRRDGLVHYCTVHRGFEVGREGFQYGGTCPPGHDQEFLRGFDLGRRFFDVESRLARIDDQLRAYRVQYGAPELDEQRREQLSHLIRDFETQRWRLESDYRQLEWEYRQL